MRRLKASYENGTVILNQYEISIRSYFTPPLEESIADALILRDGFEEELLENIDGKKVVRNSGYSRAPKNNKSKSILVVFDSGELGDRYMLVAVLKAYKVLNPDLKLDILVLSSDRDKRGYISLFTNNRYIDNAYLNAVPNKEYKEIYELGALRIHSKEFINKTVPKSRMEIWGETLGVDSKTLYNVINRESIIDHTNFEKNVAIQKTKEFDDKRLVAIAPFGSNYFKEWPNWRWQELVNVLTKEHNCICFVLHAKSTGMINMLHGVDEAKFNNSFLVDDLGYRTLSAFIKKMDVLIGIDAAQTNIAGLVGTPFIVLTGPQSGQSYTKFFRNKVVLERNWDCAPCWYPFGIPVDPNSEFAKECSHLNHSKCIYDIQVDEVVEAVEKLLNLKNTINKEKISFYCKPHPDECNCSFCIIKNEILNVMRGKYDFRLEALDEEALPKGINLGVSNVFIRNGKKFLTYLYENDLIPKKWIKYFDEEYDYIICVSEYIKEVFIHSGMDEKKLIVWPIGVDVDTFTSLGSTDILDSNRFRFLNIGTITPPNYPDRKGRDVLVKCYRKVFNSVKDVVLTVKSDKPIPGVSIKDPDIEFLHGMYSKEDIANLYRTTALNGVYIATDRAEGFRLPALEALSCGCYVGMSGNSGNASMLKDYVDLFKFKKVNTTFYKEFYESNEQPMWGEPDEDDICKWMENVYKNKPKVSDETVIEVQEKFSWKTLVPQLIGMIRKK